MNDIDLAIKMIRDEVDKQTIINHLESMRRGSDNGRTPTKGGHLRNRKCRFNSCPRSKKRLLNKKINKGRVNY